MILSRLGNKRAIAQKIYQLFPRHDIYIEPFFGAGGMFFSKPKAAHNFLNDIDEDVYNLFLVAVNRKYEFIDLIEKTPIHKALFDYWVKNKETEPVMSAVRFIVLSNFSYLGKSGTFRVGADLSKGQILQKDLTKALSVWMCFDLNIANVGGVLKIVPAGSGTVYRFYLNDVNTGIYRKTGRSEVYPAKQTIMDKWK